MGLGIGQLAHYTYPTGTIGAWILICANLGYFYSHFLSSHLVILNVYCSNDDFEWNLAFYSHFFWTKYFQKNIKCYEAKVLKFFLTLKKNHFFRTLFLKKKLKKTFKGEKFFWIVSEFYFKKSFLEKNVFFKCQKTFSKIFLHNILHLFQTFLVQKKCVPNCPLFKTDSFGFSLR